MKIRFATIAIAGAFGSMAEGMEEVHRDEAMAMAITVGDDCDNAEETAIANQLDELINVVWKELVGRDDEEPVEIEVPDHLREVAVSTRENLFDQGSEWSSEDDEELNRDLTMDDIMIGEEIKS